MVNILHIAGRIVIEKLDEIRNALFKKHGLVQIREQLKIPNQNFPHNP